MTDETNNSTDTATQTAVSTESPDAQNFDALTPLEEKVLRMLHGLSETDDHELRFGLGATGDDRTKLAMMEQHLLDAFEWGEMGTFEVSDRHIEAKAKIIDKLTEE